MQAAPGNLVDVAIQQPYDGAAHALRARVEVALRVADTTLTGHVLQPGTDDGILQYDCRSLHTRLAKVVLPAYENFLAAAGKIRDAGHVNEDPKRRRQPRQDLRRLIQP